MLIPVDTLLAVPDTPLTPLPPNLQFHRMIVRAHLQADQCLEADGVFFSYFRVNPETNETHLALGDCYLAAEDRQSTALPFRRAFMLAPERLEKQCQLEFGHTELQRKPRVTTGYVASPGWCYQSRLSSPEVAGSDQAP